MFGKVGVEITRTAANSTALVAAVLLSRGVKEKGVMVKPSAPAHPERGKSGLAGGIKRRLSCVKKGAAVVPPSGTHPGQGVCGLRDVPGVWAGSHRAPSCSAVPAGG